VLNEERLMIRSGIVGLVVVLSLVGTAAAQSTAPTGTIQGSVVDSSGAIIAGVRITAVQEDSGTSRTTETDATGHSHFGGLAIAAAKTGSNNSSDIESSSVLLVYRDLQKSLWNVEGVLNVLQIIRIFPF